MKSYIKKLYDSKKIAEEVKNFLDNLGKEDLEEHRSKTVEAIKNGYPDMFQEAKDRLVDLVGKIGLNSQLSLIEEEKLGLYPKDGLKVAQDVSEEVKNKKSEYEKMAITDQSVSSVDQQNFTNKLYVKHYDDVESLDKDAKDLWEMTKEYTAEKSLFNDYLDGLDAIEDIETESLIKAQEAIGNSFSIESLKIALPLDISLDKDLMELIDQKASLIAKISLSDKIEDSKKQEYSDQIYKGKDKEEIDKIEKEVKDLI